MSTNPGRIPSGAEIMMPRGFTVWQVKPNSPHSHNGHAGTGGVIESCSHEPFISKCRAAESGRQVLHVGHLQIGMPLVQYPLDQGSRSFGRL